MEFLACSLRMETFYISVVCNNFLEKPSKSKEFYNMENNF